MKKLLAGLAAFALALGLVAVTATAASAHKNTIDVTVSCTTDHQYQVTWSVTNSESDKTETITASSDTALVPIGTTLVASQTKQFVEIMPSAQAKTLTLTGTWSNEVTQENAGKLKTNDFPNCQPNHVPVTLCHATPPDTAANGWNEITVDDDAVDKQGHGTQHAADIIPAFTYWAQVDGAWTELTYQGKNLDTMYDGFTGAQVLAGAHDGKCGIVQAATAPTFAPAACTAPGVIGQGSYTIPSQPGVKYQVSINGGSYADAAAATVPVAIGTVVAVKAIGVPDWVSLTGTVTWSYTFLSPGDCIVTTTPVAPTAKAIEACNTYGSIVMPVTLGVVYTLTTGDGLQGAYTVTATPAFGYEFTGPQSVEFSGNLGVHTVCATPAVPSFQDSDCVEAKSVAATYTIPVTLGVTYQVKVGAGDYADAAAGVHTVLSFPTTVTIRAVADSGYTLVGYTGPWSHTFETDGGCIPPTLQGSTAASECVANAPWISFNVELTDPDNVSTSQNVHLILTDGGTNTVDLFLGPLVDGKLSGKTLWPGASVGSDGVTPTGWPGWVNNGDGTYSPTTGNFNWTRGAITAMLSVNPQLPVTLSYPEATPNCKDLPTLGPAFPKLSYTQPTCTAAGSYTIGGEFIVWTVNGEPQAAGTYPVTSDQTITFVAATTNEQHWLDDWVNPPPVKFTKPSTNCTMELTTLALTGVATGAGLAFSGGIVFLGVCLVMFGRRRFAK